MDEYDPNGADGERYLVCSNLIACHTLWYDNTNADCGYTLSRVVVHIRAPDGYPYRLPWLFLYAQLHGAPGEYIVRVRLIEIVVAEGEEVEQSLRDYGPWEIAIPGENYVECYGLKISNIFLAGTGIYEFQLWADGFDGPLARERFEARE